MIKQNLRARAAGLMFGRPAWRSRHARVTLVSRDRLFQRSKHPPALSPPRGPACCAPSPDGANGDGGRGVTLCHTAPYTCVTLVSSARHAPTSVFRVARVTALPAALRFCHHTVPHVYTRRYACVTRHRAWYVGILVLGDGGRSGRGGGGGAQGDGHY